MVMKQPPPPKTPKKTPSPKKDAAHAQVLRVLNDMATGTPISQAAKKEKVLYTTILMRIRKNPELSALYLEAKHARAAIIADGLLDMADEEPQYNKNGVDPAWVQWQRNRIETRKWLIGKLFPSEYGSTAGEAITGGGVKVTISIDMDLPEPTAQPLEASPEGWG